MSDNQFGWLVKVEDHHRVEVRGSRIIASYRFVRGREIRKIIKQLYTTLRTKENFIDMIGDRKYDDSVH